MAFSSAQSILTSQEDERLQVSPAVHQNGSHSLQETHLLQCEIHNHVLFPVHVCDKSTLELSVASRERVRKKLTLWSWLCMMND